MSCNSFGSTTWSMQHDLHDREYTMGYNRHTAETVLKETKRSHREVCALDPSIPDFDNRTYRRALKQALETLGTAEEHYAGISLDGAR
jgi:hypothetical protein